MGEGEQDAERRAELVVVALPGVQRFLEEARSTGDVAAASGIYARLAGEVARSLRAEPGADLVLPAAALLDEPEEQRGMPNRVVALLPAGTGADVAARAVAAADKAWQDLIRDVWRLRQTAEVPRTPGFPVLHWVCVPAGNGGYEEQWRQAQRLLAARRRVRDFAPVPEDDWRRRDLCSLSPRWPAVPAREIPPRVPGYDKNARLSVVGWVKHRWARVNREAVNRDDHEERFPSTASIASAAYRREVLRHRADVDVRRPLEALERAGRALGAVPEVPVPGLARDIPAAGLGRWLGISGGPWVYPGRWRPAAVTREAGPVDDLAQLARAGELAARDLVEAMGKRGVQLAAYLAVVVQDLDRMGEFLSGGAADAKLKRIKVSSDEHRQRSTDLLTVEVKQRRALRSAELLGVPVYAGGDDLLAFTTAATALKAAEDCHDAIPPSLPWASTAVLYFHYHASIRQAMSEARRLLDAAKDGVPGKHGLAVGYLRRSGASSVSIQPWSGPDGGSSAGLFGIFADGQAGHLSPRLAADLLRDAGELTALAEASERLYRAELARLVRRHADDRVDRTTAGRVARALAWLGDHEHAPDKLPGPHVAAQVGVFLRQEAR